MALEKLLVTQTPLPPLGGGKVCFIDDSSVLGLLQLPLIARLQGCVRLLGDVSRELRLVGVDGTSIDLYPITSSVGERLRAHTPINEASTIVDWDIPLISLDSIKELISFLGLVKAGETSLVNPLPYELVIEDIEGLIHGLEGGEIRIIHPVKRIVESSANTVKVYGKVEWRGDNILVEIDDIAVVLSPFKLAKVVSELYPGNRSRIVVYSTNNDVLILGKDEVVIKPSHRLTLRISHGLYNPLLKVLQPLAFAETRKHTSIVSSKIICIVDGVKETCIHSTSTLKATIAPGTLTINKVNSTTRISYGRSMYTAINSLRQTLFQLNGLVSINGILRYGYLRITPYTALLLKTSFNVKENIGVLSLYILNTTDRVAQVEVTLPARIVKASIVKLGENIVDEVEVDYNSLIFHMDKYSLYRIDLSLKKLPLLFLKELSKRPSISTYTTP